MRTIAVVSTTGGAGRTTIAAALAVLLARRNRTVVALDLDPQNLLGAHLGLDAFAPNGLGHAIAGQADVWEAPTWRNGDGVLFAPYGELAAAERTAAEGQLAAEPRWLARALARLDLPPDGVVLIDTPRYPSLQAEQAVDCADLALCVTPPEPGACATFIRRLSALKATGAHIKIVVNRLNPTRDMQCDALAMLRVAANDADALAERVHFDAAMPDAFARGSWLFDDAPHSQASHDLQGLAGWLDTWLDKRVASAGQAMR
ncbi:MAG TPA: cellulose biosynthesis protein BcsQ [Trinickia sp.]|jgi:cellulose synthase operon protein YhjQ|uniref:cellulose biosynthesis protein BcsQ n=1 Tax=Trinickia sp. TaxID=2571163 RepID=UPI002CE89ADC|nr:cellulose biosynthesis protein BcsQ [Trinickia sp.]HTI18277.1 cellulose biosynthesis protein BcsQ [Trinickia sp.]